MAELIENVLARARTYQVPLWPYHSHPQLNPYRLASQGYAVHAQDLLRCDTCHHQVPISPDTDADHLPQLQQALQQHERQCLFAGEQGSTISASLLYMSLQDLLAAIDKLAAKTAPRPLLNSKALLSLVSGNAFLFHKVLSLYEIDQHCFKVSLMLQLTGWHLVRQEEQDWLSCHFCGRRVAAGQFETVAEDRHEPERERATAEERLFNPVDEHRYFCMWVEGGWLTFLQNLEDKFEEMKVFKFKTAPLETQRVRMHIEKYLDGFREKVEVVLHKLTKNTAKVTALCQGLGEDYVLDVSDNESDVKRLRDKEHDIELQQAAVAQGMKNSFKKVKTN